MFFTALNLSHLTLKHSLLFTAHIFTAHGFLARKPLPHSEVRQAQLHAFTGAFPRWRPGCVRQPAACPGCAGNLREPCPGRVLPD